MPQEIENRLIVALDVDSAEKARDLVEKLDGVVSFFKVGMELQLAGGIELLDSLISKGKKVFLDLKYFDVPQTVERAVRRAASLGVSFLTIHGNRKNVEAAVRGRGPVPSGTGRGSAALKLLAVTVLTSLDASDIQDLGFPCSVEELVLYRAKAAAEEGCDGVVASGQEAKKIREAVGQKLLIVTPGIRPAGFPKQDQKRAVTPGEAILAGADYLVVGRPITSSPDPRQAAELVLEEMRQGYQAAHQP